MKRYVMTRRGRELRVTVYRVQDGITTRVGALRHLVRHSLDGFEWGYGGSGPADLARSIVGDLLGQADPDPIGYQLVKAKLVARLPDVGGTITEDQVLEVPFDRLHEDQV